MLALVDNKTEVDDLTIISDQLEDEPPETILEWAFAQYGDRVAIATGFGPEGTALIDMAVRVNSAAKIFYLDTGVLFPETYDLKESLERKYSLRIISYQSDLSLSQQADKYGAELWKTNPDLCCKLRKLDPLKEALTGLDAWVTAIRRDQSPARANARVVEWDQKWNLVKINPLARWTKREVWDYIIHNNVPYNPLHDLGYPSIGCTHCTKPIQIGEDDRAGRWRGLNKTECGLHG